MLIAGYFDFNCRTKLVPHHLPYFHIHLPDKKEVTAAIRKDRSTAGPACSLATDPAITYTPIPSELLTPAVVTIQIYYINHINILGFFI